VIVVVAAVGDYLERPLLFREREKEIEKEKRERERETVRKKKNVDGNSAFLMDFGIILGVVD
jgi:hypothetical protein